MSLLCSAMKERLSAFFQTEFGDTCQISGFIAHLVFWFIILSFNMRLFENFEIILYDWKERTSLADWGIFEWESKIPVCVMDILCIGIVSKSRLWNYKWHVHFPCIYNLLWIHISYDLTGKSHAALTCKPCCHMRGLRKT